jgi:hypothetical protein
LECGGAPPLLRSILRSTVLVFACSTNYSYPVPKSPAPWPHAPKHQLSKKGTYFVTAGTYLKAHHFGTPQPLDVLERGLLSVAYAFTHGVAHLPARRSTDRRTRAVDSGYRVPDNDRALWLRPDCDALLRVWRCG